MGPPSSLRDARLVDVVIVGGGVAGLSAALTLGRSRRTVALVDAGAPRNLPSPLAHNLFTRDGTPPRDLIRLGREQLGPYPTVKPIEGSVVDARALPGGGFEARLGDGGALRARRVILATGVRDELPPIPGLRDRWGASVFHCPYCHGHEARDAPIAVIAAGDAALQQARLMRGWTDDVVVLTNGGALDGAQAATLARMGIEVHREPIAELLGKARELEAIRLAHGKTVARRAAFLRPPTKQASDLPARLGCGMTASGHVEVGVGQQTSVQGVYAAGDLARQSQQLVFAAADGAAAAIHLNHALLEEDHPF